MDPRFIGKYEVVESLGKGSMGVVYKAQDPEIGRVVAIKTLRSVLLGEDAAGNEAMQRFRQESRSAGKLQHPNIVTIFEAGRTDTSSPYIVMEFIDGKSLETLLKEHKVIEPFAALHYLAQVASAVDYAHSQNVIHRDIKPSNIIVDSFHRPHLLDFGVAKLSDTSLTPAGTVVGTPSYMSPEQIKGETLDGGTDLFALAVVSFEVLSGSRPFPGTDFTTVVSNIIHKEPPSFAELGLKFPAGAETVLLKGLSKDRTKRYSRALEFMDALSRSFGVMIDGMGLIGGYTSSMKYTFAEVKDDVTQHSKVSSAAPNWLQSSEKKNGPKSEKAKKNHEIESPKPANGHVKGKTIELSVAASGVRDSEQRDPTFFGEFLKGLIGFVAFFFVAIGAALYFFPEYLSVLKSYYADIKLFGSDDNSSDNKVSSNDLGKDKKEELTAENGKVQEREVIKKEVKEDVKEIVKVKPTTESLAITPSRPSFTGETISESQAKALLDSEIAYLLSSSNTSVQVLKSVLKEAGSRGNPDLTRLIGEVSDHPNFTVRVETLKALNLPKHYQREIGFKAIVARLDDSEYLVRGFAARIVGAIGGAEAVSALQRRMAVEKDPVVLKILGESLLKASAGAT